MVTGAEESFSVFRLGVEVPSPAWPKLVRLLRTVARPWLDDFGNEPAYIEF